MAITATSFNNKNQYRKYPLKQGASFKSAEGYTLADDLIVNASITATYGLHRLYIRQVFYKAPRLQIAIASVFDDAVVGVFSGDVTDGFTVFNLQPFVRYMSGSLTIAKVNSLVSQTSLNFTKEATEFEESVIFCYTPPKVTSISDNKGTELRGNVKFGNLVNVTKTTNTQINLTALNPAAVFNTADKSSGLGNCKTPIIKTINNVEPYAIGEGSADNDGNVYLVGVKPVVFYGLPLDENELEPGIVKVATEGLTLDSLCAQKRKLLPPIDISGFTLPTVEFQDKYYSRPEFATDSVKENYPYTIPARYASNFNNTKLPEYYFWPQFVKENYYTNWSLK